jgi:hypothetical protein
MSPVEAERQRELAALPECGHEPHLVFVVKRNEHVALVLQNQSSGERAAVFTLHEVEARKLAERLLKIAAGEDNEYDLVEAAYLGGPPRADQLVR